MAFLAHPLRFLTAFLFLNAVVADVTSTYTNCVTRTTRGRSCANTVTVESSFTRTGPSTTTTTTTTPVVGSTNTFTRFYTSTLFFTATVTRDVTTSSVTDFTFTTVGATATVTSTVSGLTTITTIAGSTTTIPTSAGFTPIASYVSGASSTASIFQRDLEKRQRPTSAACANTVQCRTRTVIFPAVTSTVTAPTSTGVFYTSTVVTVTTSRTDTYASYSSTAYVFTTSTSTYTADTSTVVLFPYTTTTATPAVATVYAACQADNVINRVGGVPINGASYTALDGNIGLIPNIYSAVDCCAACQQNPSCSGALYVDGIPPQCQLVGIAGTCNATAITQDFNIGYPGQLTIMNANCGKWHLQPNLQYVGSS